MRPQNHFLNAQNHILCTQSWNSILWNCIEKRTMKAVQKVRSRIFCLFFRQHWNKLPRGECSGGLYDHTIKIWKLCVCFSSYFSLVKVELPVTGAIKFEMRMVIHFLHAEGQLTDIESHFSIFSPWNPLLRCPGG